jgi:hypothetical protein
MACRPSALLASSWHRAQSAPKRREAGTGQGLPQEPTQGRDGFQALHGSRDGLRHRPAAPRHRYQQHLPGCWSPCWSPCAKLFCIPKGPDDKAAQGQDRVLAPPALREAPHDMRRAFTACAWPRLRPLTS